MNHTLISNYPVVLRSRLEGLLAGLETGLVERRRMVRLTLLTALAGEHTLLIGPPGTAKSELARRLHLAFHEASYFERLLTRFSVPEELFGPLSISALEQDRYERQTAGFLPQATIAFIDEVFKANSAILNALLTLLNEREFDNGAGREQCPLISCVGATNEVPSDEVAEAFFDRFLTRLPVGAVSAEGFLDLLGQGGDVAMPDLQALRAEDREAIAAAARGVTLAPEVLGLLAELRERLRAEQGYVSDRRWVKIAWLLKVMAATEGRARVALWDLWLLPWCVAADMERQVEVDAWLCGRLGVREAFAPPRLTRVVQAFEAQIKLEEEADDLDYDESGRLRFNQEVEAQVSDAKGGTQAMRMSYKKRRRYGRKHIEARVRQIDDLIVRIADYAEEIALRRGELADYLAQSLWLDGDFARRADANLQATGEVVDELRQRALLARARFEALPPLPPTEPGAVPEPVDHEALS
ncbi:MAG TPA: AAA family ATPase [Rhodocyclaceae bacterium]